MGRPTPHLAWRHCLIGLARRLALRSDRARGPRTSTPAHPTGRHSGHLPAGNRQLSAARTRETDDPPAPGNDPPRRQSTDGVTADYPAGFADRAPGSPRSAETRHACNPATPRFRIRTARTHDRQQRQGGERRHHPKPGNTRVRQTCSGCFRRRPLPARQTFRTSCRYPYPCRTDAWGTPCRRGRNCCAKRDTDPRATDQRLTTLSLKAGGKGKSTASATPSRSFTLRMPNSRNRASTP